MKLSSLGRPGRCGSKPGCIAEKLLLLMSVYLYIFPRKPLHANMVRLFLKATAAPSRCLQQNKLRRRRWYHSMSSPMPETSWGAVPFLRRLVAPLSPLGEGGRSAWLSRKNESWRLMCGCVWAQGGTCAHACVLRERREPGKEREALKRLQLQSPKVGRVLSWPRHQPAEGWRWPIQPVVG